MNIITKIFICLAFGFMMAHNCTAHHHHYGVTETISGHHDSSTDNIFSEGNLDETYVYKQWHSNIFISSFILITPVICPSADGNTPELSFHPLTEKIPDKEFIAESLLRGPPVA